VTSCVGGSRSIPIRTGCGNPEDEYADDQYAEDREQPSGPAEIPDDEPEDDVLEQRQEVPYGDDER
jgi:hypothetical protein